MICLEYVYNVSTNYLDKYRIYCLVRGVHKEVYREIPTGLVSLQVHVIRVVSCQFRVSKAPRFSIFCSNLLPVVTIE